MTDLDNIKNEVAKERGRKSFYTLFCLTLEPSKQIEIVEEIAKRYATACVKASLEKAADNAQYKIDEWAQGGAYIEKESIDNPDNIVLL